MSGHEEKAKRYIGLLDAARANGSWSELPELVRKVKKHAPHEILLAQTATAEHLVATHTDTRPSAAPSIEGPLNDLKQTLSNSKDILSEAYFQGRACQAWAAWTGITKSHVVGTNAYDPIAVFDKYGGRTSSRWTMISALRDVLIEANTFQKSGNVIMAGKCYSAAESWIKLSMEQVKLCPQLAYWSEQILAASALSPEQESSDTRATIFRIWSDLTSLSQGLSPKLYGNTDAHIPRETVWKAYYAELSSKLKLSSAVPSASAKRSQLVVDLKRAEAAYESNLLRSRSFPKATESNKVVEDWIESAISNWIILCGPAWPDSDLGGSGRVGITREMLDILYRAASKTFHSTLILRRLFQVHKTLTEFELAYRCLDTYIELIEKTKARQAKTGERDAAADTDDIIFGTVSEGIEGLCAYGGQKQAQRAFELSVKLEDWLDMLSHDDDRGMASGKLQDEEHGDRPLRPRLSVTTLQIAYRSIGIAKAHWAKASPFTESRSELQAEALVALKKACNSGEPQLSSMYALALLSAETREMMQSVRWTKSALEYIAKQANLGRSVTGVRDQTAFWHMMSLLLSAQHDFDTATESSQAALEQVLVHERLATMDNLSITNNDIAKTSQNVLLSSSQDLDDLQRIIELQTSYLALVELLEGPEIALNHGSELLSLYGKLFKGHDIPTKTSQDTINQDLRPPQTSAGTIRSIRGSIFSRRKIPPASIALSATTSSLNSPTDTVKEAKQMSDRPLTQASQAPQIQIIDEQGHTTHNKHNGIPHLHLHRHHDKKDIPQANRVLQVDRTIDEKDMALSPISDNSDMEKDSQLPLLYFDSPSGTPRPIFAADTRQKHAMVILTKVWITIAKLYTRSRMFEDAREAIDEAGKAALKIEALVTAQGPPAQRLSEAGWGGGRKSSDGAWADVCCTKAELLLAIIERRLEEGGTPNVDAYREVVDEYESCLMYSPDHAHGIIGLSDMLLDYYERKIELAKRVDDGSSLIKDSESMIHRHNPEHETQPAGKTPVMNGQKSVLDGVPSNATSQSAEELRKTPENLNRIAARDRAYGLLSTLTKMGHGWDNSEAWYTLARAHELGGELDKAKSILWYCIELEDTRPIRHWRNLGSTGYVL